MKIICKYLLLCEDPEYDNKLVEAKDLLSFLSATSLGPWTGEKSIYGRIIHPQFREICAECTYCRKSKSQNGGIFYCAYKPKK